MKKTLLTLILDTIILIISFLLWSMMWYGALDMLIIFRAFIIIFLLVWILTAFILNKYARLLRLNSIKQIELIIRHVLYVFMLSILILYFFHINVSSTFILGVLFINIPLQLLFISIANFSAERFLIQDYKDKPPPLLNRHYHYDEKETLPKIEEDEELTLSLYRTLKDIYLSKFPQVFDFINEHIATRRIHTDDSLILNTRTIYNIEHNPSENYKVFLNLRQMNDFWNIERFLVETNNMLKPGGYYISCGQTIQQRCDSLNPRHDCLFLSLKCFLDKLIKMTLPRIPYLKNIYYYITDGNNRLLSQSEMIDHLNSNGFQIIAFRTIANKTYFITRKMGICRELGTENWEDELWEDEKVRAELGEDEHCEDAIGEGERELNKDGDIEKS